MDLPEKKNSNHSLKWKLILKGNFSQKIPKLKMVMARRDFLYSFKAIQCPII